MPQCDVGSTAKTLIIHFDQKKFEQLFSRGSTGPLQVCKHRKVSVARAPLATFEKQVSVKIIEVLCEPNIASCEAKPAPCAPKQALERLNRLCASLDKLCVSPNRLYVSLSQSQLRRLS